MQKLIIFSLFTISCLFFTSTAHAQRSSNWLKWLDQSSFNLDYYPRPNLKDGTTPHAYIKHEGPWEPEDWITAKGSAEAVIADLYKGGMITDQSSDDGVPVLEVGNTFMMLDSRTQAKILEFLDYAYGITQQDPLGMIHIEHDRTDKRIGLYTADGLAFQ